MKEDTYRFKVRLMKKQVRENKYPPTYNAKKYVGKTMNCYAYCFDIAITDASYAMLFPGCISNYRAPKDLYRIQDVIKGFIKDAIFLGFSK